MGKGKEARKESAGYILQFCLDGFESYFAFLFGTWFADPHDATADGLEFILAGNDLHDLAAPEPEASPEPESLGGAIHNQAGDPLRVGAEVDDDAGTFLRDDAFGAAALVAVECGHGFVLGAIFPHIYECRVNKKRGPSGEYLRFVHGVNAQNWSTVMVSRWKAGATFIDWRQNAAPPIGSA